MLKNNDWVDTGLNDSHNIFVRIVSPCPYEYCRNWGTKLILCQLPMCHTADSIV